MRQSDTSCINVWVVGSERAVDLRCPSTKNATTSRSVVADVSCLVLLPYHAPCMVPPPQKKPKNNELQ